jgi:hypothetical protein
METDWEGMDWINMAQDKNGYEPLDSIKCWESVE